MSKKKGDYEESNQADEAPGARSYLACIVPEALLLMQRPDGCLDACRTGLLARGAESGTENLALSLEKSSFTKSRHAASTQVINPKRCYRWTHICFKNIRGVCFLLFCPLKKKVWNEGKGLVILYGNQIYFTEIRVKIPSMGMNQKLEMERESL